MRFFHIVLLFFLVVPFIEIYLLLKIGSVVGVAPTVALVVFTAVLGAWMLRQQGFATLQRFKNSLDRGVIPAREMIEGPILLVGGALLLTPGFFTDIVGFACLIPVTRGKIAAFLIEKYMLTTDGEVHRKSSPDSNVIEGEFRKEDD